MSEPIFEASVRLRIAQEDFERQGLATIKGAAERFEADAESRLARFEQRQVQRADRIQAELARATAPPPAIGQAAALELEMAQAKRMGQKPVAIDVMANTAPFEHQVKAAVQEAETEVAAVVADVSAPRRDIYSKRTAAQQAERDARLAEEAIREKVGESQFAGDLFELPTGSDAERDREWELVLQAETQRIDEFHTKIAQARERAAAATQAGDTDVAQIQEQAAAALELKVVAAEAQLAAQQAMQSMEGAEGAEAERLLAAADEWAEAAAGARDEVAKAERQAKDASQGRFTSPALPPGALRGISAREAEGRAAGPGEALFGPGGLLRGRTGGLAGIVGMTSRFGAAGLGFGAVIGGLGEAQRALRVTGNEAFSAEGKLRNLGAELLTGNIVGGIKALAAFPEARLVGGLPAQIQALQALKDKTDFLAISEEKLLAVRSRGRVASAEYIYSLRALGVINDKTVKDLLEVTEELYKQTTAAQASGNALRALAERRAVAPSEGLLPPRAPGAQFQRTGVPEGVTFGSREQTLAAGAANLAVANQIRASIIARTKNDRERLALELQHARIIEAQAVAGARAAAGTRAEGAALANQVTAQTEVILRRRALADAEEAAAQLSRDRGNAIAAAGASLIENRVAQTQRELRNATQIQAEARAVFAAKLLTGEVGAAWHEYVLATLGVVGATRTAKDAVEQATVEAQGLASRVRDAATAAIEDPGQQTQAALRSAQIEENDARKRYNAAEKGARGEEYTALQEAISARKQAQQAVTASAKSAAEVARQEAETAAASAQNATEQTLANNIAAAALTKSKSDDIKHTNIAIDYYRAEANNASNTAEERATARSKVISLRGSLTDGGTEGLGLQKLQNAMQQAEAVGSIPLMRRASDKIISYWERQRDSLTGMEKAVAQSNLTTERARARQFDAEVDSREDLVFQNRAAAARLRGDEGAEKRIADDLIAVWRKRVKDAVGFDAKLRAQSGLLEAQTARKALEGGDTDEGGGPTTIDFLGITRKIFQDFAGNLLPTGGDAAARGLFAGLARPPDLPDFGPRGAPETFDETLLRDKSLAAMRGLPGLFEPTDVPVEDEELRELRRIRELLEQGAATTEVKVDQHFAKPDYSGFQQARWIKFAMEQVANG